MPSASNGKTDKQIAPESGGLAVDSATPLRQAITIIEHKIRNLEKRKSKLESYKELQNAGKELNGDQKTAVAKYDEVIQTLDFARDLCKQFLGIVAGSEKEAKKQAKKEAAAKSQAELARLREILLVQDALNQMGNESVRDDFLQGRNGAAQLSEADLKLLDDLYPAVTPKHESGNPTAFTNEVQAAAEHLLAVVDGKPKEIFGGTYSQIKEVLGKIHESGYFDQQPVQDCGVEQTNALDSSEEEAIYVQEEPEALGQTEIVQENAITVAQQQPILEPPHVEQQLSQEQLLFQRSQSQIPMQPINSTGRPLTEMLGAGSFFFLQESEIDNTPIEQIPSQTFTNQNYVGGPPPPIPMPPHFQTMAPQVQGGHHVPMAPPAHQGIAPKNGIDDNLNNVASETIKQSTRNNYYQSTNNNYNRPRQNRNNGSRHHNNNRN